jgi:hypothetical protein
MPAPARTVALKPQAAAGVVGVVAACDCRACLVTDVLRYSRLPLRFTFAVESSAISQAPFVLPVRSLSSITPRPPS